MNDSSSKKFTEKSLTLKTIDDFELKFNKAIKTEEHKEYFNYILIHFIVALSNYYTDLEEGKKDESEIKTELICELVQIKSKLQEEIKRLV